VVYIPIEVCPIQQRSHDLGVAIFVVITVRDFSIGDLARGRVVLELVFIHKRRVITGRQHVLRAERKITITGIGAQFLGKPENGCCPLRIC